MALSEIIALLRQKDKILYPITQLKNITDDAEAKTAPADADSVPIADASDSGQMKKITWASIKTALSSVFASKSHDHSTSDITGINNISITGTAEKVGSPIATKFLSTQSVASRNELQEKGGFAAGYLTSSADGPPGTDHAALALNYNNSLWSVMIAGDWRTGKLYVCTRNSGTWGDWKEVAYTDVATTAANGLMSADDKKKLDGIATGANKYTHPAYTARSSDLYKITVDATGHVSAIAAVSASDLASFGLTATADELNYMDGVTSGVQAQLNAKAPTASPSLTGTPKAPTAAAGTNTTQIATTAFVTSAVNNVLAATNAMVFRGTIGSSGATVTALPASHHAGDVYIVKTAGSYAGEVCEVGDMVLCVTTGTTANNAHWTVVQTNINGAVTGPTSAVTNRVAVFNGTTGKIIKDSGFTIGASVPANAKFTDTTYSAMNGASASAAGAAGLVPAPAAGAATRYLRSDGTWAVPPDTNTTYTLSSFGITATASELNHLDGITATVAELNKLHGLTATTAELNFVDGVTSNIQTQLNNKAAKSKVVTVTLSSSQWTESSSGYTQKETVSGVSAKETDQMIHVVPSASSQSVYLEAGVYASGQAENSIIFIASEKPSVNLTVYVVIETI